jgi:hypothetical protein
MGHIDALNSLLNTEVVVKTVIEKQPQQFGWAIRHAAKYGRLEELKKLLKDKNILNKVIVKCPTQLGWAVYEAVKNKHHASLDELLNNEAVINAITTKHTDILGSSVYYVVENKDDEELKLITTNQTILEAINQKSPEIFKEIQQKIKEVKNKPTSTTSAGDASKSKNTTPSLEENAPKSTRKWGATFKAARPFLIAAGVAASVITGGFAAMLLASRIHKVKNCSLVANFLVPAFNKMNNQLIKISPKLDLNELTKVLSNPKLAALMIGITALLGIMTAMVAGVSAHSKQISISSGS